MQVGPSMGRSRDGGGRVGLCSLGRDIIGLCTVRMGPGWVLAEGAGLPTLLGCSSATASLRYSTCRERAAFAADECGRDGERHPQPTGPSTVGAVAFKRSLNEKV